MDGGAVAPAPSAGREAGRERHRAETRPGCDTSAGPFRGVIAIMRLIWLLLAAAPAAGLWTVTPALAQGGWSSPTITPDRPDWRAPDPNAVAPSPEGQQQPRNAPDAPLAPSGQAILALEAMLTADSPPIDRGLVWRVFRLGSEAAPPNLVTTSRDAQATLVLPPGQYAVNAAFGRAHLTQILTLEAGRRHMETFVLNAGGLRVKATVAGAAESIHASARYDIFTDERDQSGNRRRILSNARPELITRLNSGIYHIVSRLGDANAMVAADVAVEAGKLTEAVVAHEAGKATFKLVREAAGEAQADTQWIIMTQGGEIVKETAGALPTHLLAPGSYSVSARWGGQLFTKTFEIKSGDNIEIEVMMQ